MEGEKFISSHDGHFVNAGCTRPEGIRNSYEIWEINNSKCVKMKVLSSGNEVFTIFDYDDLEKVKSKNTWYVMETGYVACSNPFKYLHHLVMNFEGTGKGFQKISVDHINRDKLDNRKENLRLATSKEQQENSKGRIENTKRERQKGAVELPDGIKQDQLPKYVSYRIEFKKNGDTEKEYFVVESYPAFVKGISVNGTKLKKAIKSSSSLQISVKNKLEEIIEISKELKTILDESNSLDTLQITRPATKIIDKITGKITNGANKLVYKYDANKELVKTYNSQLEASNCEGCSTATIYRAVKNKTMFAGHFYSVNLHG